MGASSYKMELGMAPAAYTVAIVGALFLAPPTAFVIKSLLQMADGKSIIIRHPGQELGMVVLFALVGSLAACLLLWLRQPGGAHITWDENGVTDFDGDGVRVAIRWEKLKRGIIQVVLTQTGSATRKSGGQIHQISDDDGRRITYSTSDARAGWMFSRRLFTNRDSLYFTGFEQKGPFPKGEVEPDNPGRPATGIAINFTRLGYIALLAAVIFLMGKYSSSEVDNARFAGLMLSIGGGLLLLRVIRPLAELLRIRREGRRFQGAKEFELVDNVGLDAIVKDAEGNELRFDTTSIKHPDGLLETRRGPVRLVLKDAPATEGLYTVEALEHAGTYKARKSLKRAVFLEIGVRSFLALFFGLVGAYLLMKYL
ncbi:MAG: hypothetical protein JRJ87_10730 [Deltaproteobacteria bacterium]|nr:hypothetical protein [Deltaproteobacteria bacterium]